MKKILILVLIGITLAACNTEPSLQEYLVEKENSTQFISASLPTNLLFQNLDDIPAKKRASLEKIKKINLLALTKKEGESILEVERKEINQILSKPDYESLMNYSGGAREAKLYLVGSEDKINELVFFGYDAEIGLIVLRMLGDDVTGNDIMQITQSAQQLNMDALPGEFGDLIGEMGKQ